jgi:predicted NUDIX family NTP pyrophosphohydrolase
MPKTSAGILLYRFSQGDGARQLEILLVHPGGPIWAKRDEGAWSIPKGEYGADDDPAECARREFEEEIGHPLEDGPWDDLGEVVQAGGKRVRAWAVRGDLDVEEIKSNTFEMVWPPRSGHVQSFPEVDKARWMGIDEAMRKLVPAQVGLLERLLGLDPRPERGAHERRTPPAGPSRGSTSLTTARSAGRRPAAPRATGEG